MNEDQKTYAGCFLVILFVLFIIFVSVAVGLLVGAWAGCATLAAFVAIWIVLNVIGYKKMNCGGDE